jgi:hypothetical protein
VSTPEQPERPRFSWGRAIRVGSIIAAGFGAFGFVVVASLEGPDSEALLFSLFATLVLAPFSIAIAALVLRLRRTRATWT